MSNAKKSTGPTERRFFLYEKGEAGRFLGAFFGADEERVAFHADKVVGDAPDLPLYGYADDQFETFVVQIRDAADPLIELVRGLHFGPEPERDYFLFRDRALTEYVGHAFGAMSAIVEEHGDVYFGAEPVSTYYVYADEAETALITSFGGTERQARATFPDAFLGRRPQPSIRSAMDRALAKIDVAHADVLDQLTGRATPVERDTWSRKLLAARGVLSGSPAANGVSALTKGAGQRGLTVDQFAEVIMGKDQSFTALIDEADVLRDKARSRVLDCETADQVESAITAALAEMTAPLAAKSEV